MTTPEIRFDWARAARTGTPEAVLCTGKTTEQLRSICAEAAKRKAALLLTRLTPSAYASVGIPLDYDERSGTAFFGEVPQPAHPTVAVICAGTTDLPVATEASRTLQFMGIGTTLIADVGVAGIWRLLDNLERIAAHKVIIAAAGMEGALFSVLGGLVAAPIIAVPTSVGYGVNAGGHNALNSALGSCAPGVVTVNIDNGFGAALAAARMLNVAK